MSNRWNIPRDLEATTRARDTRCVYCGASFTDPQISRGSSPSWERIFNDTSIITEENIALCCLSCNASKGAKPLIEWLESNYCKRRGISYENVADVVRMALRHMDRDSGGQ